MYMYIKMRQQRFLLIFTCLLAKTTIENKFKIHKIPDYLQIDIYPGEK